MLKAQRIYKKNLCPESCEGSVEKFSNNMLELTDREYLIDDFSDGTDAENFSFNFTLACRLLRLFKNVPLPRLSLTSASLCFVFTIFMSPHYLAEKLIFPAFRLSFGTLYPAYASYKAVRTKNVKEYVS